MVRRILTAQLDQSAIDDKDYYGARPGARDCGTDSCGKPLPPLVPMHQRCAQGTSGWSLRGSCWGCCSRTCSSA